MTAERSKRPESGGMEVLPPVFERPVLKDAFFWLFLGTLAFWVLAIWYLFF